jgi:hypothetical protein
VLRHRGLLCYSIPMTATENITTTKPHRRGFFLADGYVYAGDVLDLADGRRARIREFAPVGTLPAGTWVVDPRNDIICMVTGPSAEWPVIIGGDLCAMPGEVMPVLVMVDPRE